jgi:DNA-binding transcriptional regulator YiaG|tara:strand:+ start:2533 stop:2712 length:180 start_codon:yes stop_codon:yes gene_type:complete
MTTNQRIYKAWDRSGLTQQEFADELHVPLTTMLNWFRPESNAAYRKSSEAMAAYAEIIF